MGDKLKYFGLLPLGIFIAIGALYMIKQPRLKTISLNRDRGLTHAFHAIGIDLSNNRWKNCGREFFNLLNPLTLAESSRHVGLIINGTRVHSAIMVNYIKGQGVVACSLLFATCFVIPDNRNAVAHFHDGNFMDEAITMTTHAKMGSKILISPISRQQLWELDIATEKFTLISDTMPEQYGPGHCLLALSENELFIGKISVGYQIYQNFTWHPVSDTIA